MSSTRSTNYRQQEALQAQESQKLWHPYLKYIEFLLVRKGIWQSSVPTSLALWVLRAVLPAWLRRWQVAGSSLKQCWLKRRKCFRLKIEPGKHKDE